MPPFINYDSPAFLRDFLGERGLGARKKFGQNFLVDPSARRMLLDALEPEGGEGVWEVGPGLGAMTKGLLERGARVSAFEIDPAFAGILRELFGENTDFTLIEGDVLKTWRSAPAAPFFFGNLPYNIAAVLLAGIIEEGRFFKRMVVTVQREVAARMTAAPGSADYSSISVLCASAYRLTPLRVIRGGSFYPVPGVDSRGLRFDLRPGGETAYPALFRPLVRRLFADRRKTIKNNLRFFIAPRLAGRGGSGGDMAAAVLDSCRIGPDRRAETLSLEEFAALAGALAAVLPTEELRPGPRPPGSGDGERGNP